jgi:hypothetical protein
MSLAAACSRKKKVYEVLTRLARHQSRRHPSSIPRGFKSKQETFAGKILNGKNGGRVGCLARGRELRREGLPALTYLMGAGLNGLDGLGADYGDKSESSLAYA